MNLPHSEGQHDQRKEPRQRLTLLNARQESEADAKSEVILAVAPTKIAHVLVVVIGTLLASYAITQFIRFQSGHDNLHGLIPQFDLGAENNIPTWYSSVALLVSAIVLIVIGIGKKSAGDRYAAHWLALGAIFGGLSMDEMASLHEMTMPLFRSLLEGSSYGGGYLWFSWVIAGGIFVMLVGLAYLRFLAHLPAKTRWLFLLAAALYVGGAIGMEMIGAKQHYLFGRNNYQYALIVGMEETCEMAGIALFIYALLSYLGMWCSSVRVKVS